MLPAGRNILAVAAGGMIGALLRVGFVLAFPIQPGRFPLTTFVENIVGAFLLGLALVLMLERWRRGSYLHPFLCTGILGSFTTFSNFSVESLNLIAHSDRPWLALVYAAASVVAGLAAALIGMILARHGPRLLQRKDTL